MEQVNKKIALKYTSLSRIVIVFFRLYQILVSPLIGPRCRFQPTCSNYAIEAVKRHGVFKGVLLTVKRVVRCRPGCACGVDEVP